MSAAGGAILERLASRICAFTRHDLTPLSLARARTGITDTIGVTLAGIPEPCAQILLRTPGVATAPGAALVFGTARRTSALDAALVNGTASHALDYDDFSGDLGGHQSVPLVAPLFALAEERGLSGMRLVQAYVVGMETLIRLARAVNFVHYDKGWHPTSTLGVFGAAAASAHMIGLDAPRTAIALSLAASMASGLKANFGTMAKPFHAGHCARNGLLAALMAEQGFVANPGVMEHHQGFLDVFNGPGNHDATRIFEGWGRPWEVEAPGIALKQFPCCGSTHPAIAMMLKLVREEGITAAVVERIEVLPHARRLPHTDNPHPTTPLGAKFSVQYAVVRALLSGTPKLADFEGEAALDPEAQRLLALTTARAHPDMPRDGAAQWGAEVIVTLRDGRRLSRRVNQMVGRGGDNPMSSDELWEKFHDCAERGLARENIAPLFDRLDAIEEVGDMRDLTRLLEYTAPLGGGPRFAEVERQGMPLETGWVP
ncbi:2-methylcitrate dehydratase PrpD [Humitalea rosea]|uniref:2-methylcitrate dehydratase PrpD n=1 Tax=Humitalea rosea TaxID=990373 RepID=A0A2W7HVM3_9PROT|nr:MmgE/PrpD family protein [Humitalea rosea]PZW38696.1 2-methylcitrate dehydratase PrpD [Humitalea rosea]